MFVDNMGADDVLVKLGFANVFNCFHMNHMLNIVKEVIPKIYCFCYSAYRYHLQFGSFSLSSQVGPQQGDPLAGLLFCLAIQKLLRSIHSIFSSGYMNDIMLGGNVNDVSRDVKLLKSEGEAIGLVLNVSIFEVVSKSNISNQIHSGLLKDFIALTIEESTLLGAPLRRDSALDSGLADKIAKLQTALGRIELLPAQEALIILRSSFSTPRLMHFLRCSPSFDYPLLANTTPCYGRACQE